MRNKMAKNLTNNHSFSSLDDLPHYWKMKNCAPFGSNIELARTVYVIMIVERKAALLFTRKYEYLGQMETRYAKKLIKEAYDLDWESETWKNYGIPGKFEGYPDACKVAYWIDCSKK